MKRLVGIAEVALAVALMLSGELEAGLLNSWCAWHHLLEQRLRLDPEHLRVLFALLHEVLAAQYDGLGL